MGGTGVARECGPPSGTDEAGRSGRRSCSCCGLRSRTVEVSELQDWRAAASMPRRYRHPPIQLSDFGGQIDCEGAHSRAGKIAGADPVQVSRQPGRHKPFVGSRRDCMGEHDMEAVDRTDGGVDQVVVVLGRSLAVRSPWNPFGRCSASALSVSAPAEAESSHLRVWPGRAQALDSSLVELAPPDAVDLLR